MGNFSLATLSYSWPEAAGSELVPGSAVYGRRTTRISQGSNVMTREGA